MHEQLRSYVERLFTAAPQTRKAHELKEEIFSNLTEKYDDLIAAGLEPEAAHERVIDNIGDVDELIAGLEEDNMNEPEKIAADRKKNALVVSVSIGLYILSLMAIGICNMLNVRDEISLCIFLAIVAVATILLVYNYMSRPRYKRADDTLVEEFKEFKDNSKKSKEAWHALVGAYWCLITALYFFVSFFFGAWAWSWVIFIVAAGVQNVIKAFLTLRDGR